MNQDLFQWAAIAGIFCGQILLACYSQKHQHEINYLTTYTKDLFRKAHNELAKHNSDPDMVMQDMERSAEQTEALLAGRQTLIRESAGAPAKVHKARWRKGTNSYL